MPIGINSAVIASTFRRGIVAVQVGDTVDKVERVNVGVSVFDDVNARTPPKELKGTDVVSSKRKIKRVE